jgi:hypothetical protein
MQRLIDPGVEERRSFPQRMAFVMGAVVVTGAIVVVVLVVGRWAYLFRTMKMHEARLSRLLPQKPTLDQIMVGFEQEQTSLVAIAESRRDLERIAAGLPQGDRDNVLARSSKSAKTRVFRAGEVLYFIFFDDVNIMQSFACVFHRAQLPLINPATGSVSSPSNGAIRVSPR